MLKVEMIEKLKRLGLKRAYKPYWDGDSDHGSLMLETRLFKIADGKMAGTQVDLYDDGTLRVWTSQKQRAKAIAKANRFKVELLDGEAVLFIPIARADEFLHSFGARVKKQMTEETKAKRVAALTKFREAKKAALATP